MVSAMGFRNMRSVRLGSLLALLCISPLASVVGISPDGVDAAVVVEAGERQLVENVVASELAGGEYIMAGQQLTSPSGRYIAKMQGDGNFCIYLDETIYQFCTAMDGGYKVTDKSADYKVTMQRDGNLVVSNNKKWVWGSVQSAGYKPTKDGAWRAVLQDDGILTVYNVDTVHFRSTPGALEDSEGDSRRRRLSLRGSNPESLLQMGVENTDVAAGRELAASTPAASGSSSTGPLPGETALHAAARKGNAGPVRQLLASGSVKVDAAASDGSTAMHVAAQYGRVDVLQALIDAKANHVARNGAGATPLYLAAQHGKPLALEKLLYVHGGKDTAAIDGTTPLFAAVAANQPSAVATLLEAGVNPNKARLGGASPLHAACTVVGKSTERSMTTGQYEDIDASALLVKKLLAVNADVLSANGLGWLPLHTCAANNQASSIALLLDRGIAYEKQLNRQTVAGQSALTLAAQRGHAAAVSALLTARADTSLADPAGVTALYAAAAANQPTTAALICANGANKNAPVITRLDGASPIHLASRMGYLEVVRELVACGANLDAANVKQETPLFVAAAAGYAGVVESLVLGRGYVSASEGTALASADTSGGPTGGHRHTLLPKVHDHVKANPNPVYSNKHFPGVVTASYADGTFDVTYDPPGALLNARRVATSKGVSPNDVFSIETTAGGQSWYTNHDRRPAVIAGQAAPFHAHGDSLGGAALNLVDEKGQTPLYAAANGNKLAVASLLCRAGADMDLPEGSAKKHSPLHVAATKGYTDMVVVLASAGADVNRGTSSRETPLFLASSNGKLDVVQLLVDARSADLNHQDANYHTPLDAAAQAGNVNIVRFLVVAGTRYNPLDKKGKLIESFLRPSDLAAGQAKRSELDAALQAAWAAESSAHATDGHGKVKQVKDPPASPAHAAKLNNAFGAADQNYARHQAKKLGDYKGVEATNPQGWATPVDLLLHPFPEGNGYGASNKAEAQAH